jgi:hypothetical protein
MIRMPTPEHFHVGAKTMTNSQSLVLGVALALLPGVLANAQEVKEDSSLLTSWPGLLSLGFANNGQRVSATVGQRIELTLGTVGPIQWGDPQVSSPAVRLEATAQGPVNPGGPIFIYMFDAAAEGEAEIKVSIEKPSNYPSTGHDTFAVTIRVQPASGNLRQRNAARLLDQENNEPWNNASESLDYVDGACPPKSAIRTLSQTFVPHLPRLTAIEVQLVAVKPGQGSGDVEMTLMTEHQVLAVVWKTVTAADCDHVLFPLPNGGVNVAPGEVYSIRLTGIGGVFGWKYVVGGYAQGAAFLDHKPLLEDGRSTFLFRTFGMKCVNGNDCHVSTHPER